MSESALYAFIITDGVLYHKVTSFSGRFKKCSRNNNAIASLMICQRYYGTNTLVKPDLLSVLSGFFFLYVIIGVESRARKSVYKDRYRVICGRRVFNYYDLDISGAC